MLKILSVCKLDSIRFSTIRIISAYRGTSQDVQIAEVQLELNYKEFWRCRIIATRTRGCVPQQGWPISCCILTGKFLWISEEEQETLLKSLISQSLQISLVTRLVTYCLLKSLQISLVTSHILPGSFVIPYKKKQNYVLNPWLYYHPVDYYSY